MIVEKVMNDTSLGEVQPYFAHFLLESILKNGLREKYTLQVLNKWKKPVLDCPYGLVEGFYKPDLSYRFDHSHAWGGTPLCSLPMALTGLKVLEAGYKKISLDCSLLGLEYAYVEIPTKYGLIEIKQEKGKETTISCPKEIDVTLLDDKNI